MQEPALTDTEFQQFRQLIFDIAGISMNGAKKPLVSGRLVKRLRHYGLQSYGDYYRILQQEPSERQVAVDLLTTNETYFFREPKHFDFLRGNILPQRSANRPFRIWSAACSSGEEVYSLAMVLSDVLEDRPWEVVGSDISSRMLATARQGKYPLSRATGVSQHYLHRYCLKGIGTQEGSLLIEPKLQQRTQFLPINLNETLPEMGKFEVIFLRNVMIYFDMETKRRVVQRLLPLLWQGGYLIVSHAETLNGITDQLNLVSPSIYRKPYAVN
ncbi:protein-glutamate O-methyltransferase CheR [Shewanella sp. CG12_big_fil_rev_8_21_14_0_65_47_15]|uniref:CheR family methyltransferase n=1 Tax=Shewanella sp. CG12_big_fil_rev_8_21_14_0_65_47_15 TaxID=1975537 RepID=UPI000CB31A13|nr:protein-glutamate O-methyltransferase CheR [Shewanella sp. CG12_big_fil_rev_8_21_14_0_65_47_15]PIW59253.1 MAG: SAM-dependent methyltransferase [Shewanella sp. CG12_big_fil_rev_8_21_14_0_65_47_15]